MLHRKVWAVADNGERQETRIVVELLSSADVKRLEERDNELLQEIKRVDERLGKLHQMFFEYIEKVAENKRKFS